MILLGLGQITMILYVTGGLTMLFKS